MQSQTLCVPGTIGNITGSGADGVLIGSLTATAPDAAIIKEAHAAVLCVTDDGGVYVDETTPIGEATDDDVEVLPATPAVGDAAYFGHATAKFNSLNVDHSTQGDGVWVIAWEYWDGDAWSTLTVTDGTTMFEAAVGWVSVTFTPPTDWDICPVDALTGYFIRARVTGYTSVATAPQIAEGNVTLVNATYTDETTDFNDAGADDVPLLPLLPSVGDGIFIGYEEKFCKLKLTIGQERTGTATIALKYWDGDSWEAVTTVEDDSAGWSTGAATYLTHFVPPSDWVANTAANGPNGEAGYFVSMTMTAITDVTQQPLLTQGWVFPLVTGALGVIADHDGTGTVTVSMDTQTVSGSTADSVFLLLNVTDGTYIPLTFTKATGHDSDSGALSITNQEQFALVQITEDGTTEMVGVNFVVTY